jgi:hypothetical protein
MVSLDTAIVRVPSVKILVRMLMTSLLATTGEPDIPDIQMQSKIIVMLSTPPFALPWHISLQSIKQTKMHVGCL